MQPFIHQTNVREISRTGNKYLLAPGGDLYRVSEHSFGARRLADTALGMDALKGIGIDPNRIPPTFGVTEMFKLGWLRLVTYKEIIGVTWGHGPQQVTEEQKTVLREMRARYDELNGSGATRILIGDGPDSAGRADVDL